MCNVSLPSFGFCPTNKKRLERWGCVEMYTQGTNGSISLYFLTHFSWEPRKIFICGRRGTHSLELLEFSSESEYIGKVISSDISHGIETSWLKGKISVISVVVWWSILSFTFLIPRILKRNSHHKVSTNRRLKQYGRERMDMVSEPLRDGGIKQERG